MIAGGLGSRHIRIGPTWRHGCRVEEEEEEDEHAKVKEGPTATPTGY